jgi:hypothetical protein
VSISAAAVGGDEYDSGNKLGLHAERGSYSMIVTQRPSGYSRLCTSFFALRVAGTRTTWTLIPNIQMDNDRDTAE